MKADGLHTSEAELRRRAEKLFRTKKRATTLQQTEDDAQRLLQELEIHQIELEMQNEELHQAREMAEKLLEKYTDLYDLSPVGYVTLDHHGIISAVNLTGANLLGCERSRLLGQHFNLSVAVDTRPDFAEFLDKVFTSREKKSCEMALLSKVNRPFFVQLEAAVFEPGLDCHIAFIDITKRRQAEEALKSSEIRYRRLFETSRDGILILDAYTGRIIDTNPFLMELLGYSHEDFTGRKLWEIGAFIDIAASRDAFTELQQKEFIRYEDLPLVTKDGRQIHAEFVSNVYPVGDIKLIQCNIRDISRRKREAELIERLNIDLAARAAELEEANRELEAFNYSVAHDLRQPLNVISSYCQVIKELCGDSLDEQCRGYLQGSYEGTLRMNRLIEALLDFSRMGRVEPQREHVDLAALAHEVVTMLKQTGPERQVDFRTPAELVVNADANLLRVVLNNLLGNAWKYTGMQEKAVIEFGATEIDGSPAYFVRDNGAGFDMADADKLFTPFRRLPGAEECRGFGIGLATVERIILRHGGRVWAEGEPGKGATFWFTVQ